MADDAFVQGAFPQGAFPQDLFKQGAFAQDGFRIRFDWGLAGARALSDADLFAVVDVLSFTTAVSVACEAGVEVFPFRWRDNRAHAFARRVGASLAGERSHDTPSLSPSSLRTMSGIQRLVLPSPNGSTICHTLQAETRTVIAGCLRNAAAVGRWVADRLVADVHCNVAVIAAGERWPDGSLRPASEDAWGAGAVIAAVLACGEVSHSPEAAAAVAGFSAIAADPRRWLAGCVSGRELTDSGFGSDVLIAAQVDSSMVVPRLVDGRFIR